MNPSQRLTRICDVPAPAGRWGWPPAGWQRPPGRGRWPPWWWRRPPGRWHRTAYGWDRGFGQNSALCTTLVGWTLRRRTLQVGFQLPGVPVCRCWSLAPQELCALLRLSVPLLQKHRMGKSVQISQTLSGAVSGVWPMALRVCLTAVHLMHVLSERTGKPSLWFLKSVFLHYHLVTPKSESTIWG